MALKPGDRLGPYEILAPIGAGGMGEVYRARDSKLNRDVAVKVLPAALAGDAQYMARFEREAQVLASLNHPNIATVYGIEQGALVMELVEGADLKGPIPLEEALAIARQIAAGLEAAHEKGIIHRDLKPANIKLTRAGMVKILDFGLAKTVQEASPVSSQLSVSPTFSMTMTEAGMILGTAGYMAPEQARGRAVDKRADIWAFGVVLYEIVAGKRLFEGEDLTDILASVVKIEPDFSAAPAELRRILEACLQKDPAKRLRDIGDVWRLLDSRILATTPTPPRLGMTGWMAAGVLAVVAAGASWIAYRATRPVDRPLVRLDVDLGADVSLPPPDNSGSNVAISPDGTRLVYASGTPPKLFIRRLDQPKAAELPGTDGGQGPVFSVDGQWVGFHSSQGKWKKVSVAGGSAVPVGDFNSSGGYVGASWGEDGSIVLGGAMDGGLRRIPPGGGAAETLVPMDRGTVALTRPQVLPGGKAVLFTSSGTASASMGPDRFMIEVLTLADRHRKIVGRGGSTARYLDASDGMGYLVYTNNATLFAVPFDLDKLETRGTPVPVLDDVAYAQPRGAGGLDFSRESSAHGILVYRRANARVAESGSTVEWVNAAGKREPLLAKPRVYSHSCLSPDGRRVALEIGDGGSQDIWVYDPQRDAMTRLTFGGALYDNPVWSPDGQYVIFAARGSGIFQARADGAGQPQVLTPSKTRTLPASLTPDGRRLAYFENRQIWTVPLEEQGGRLKAGQPEQFLKSSFVDVEPSFSPDGRWLAYQSNESGIFEVYVRAFPPPVPGQGGKWQISNNGGARPHWSRSGHELLYDSGDQIMAASYTVKGDAFLADKPRVWLAKLGGTSWDLAPDGKRLVVVTPVQSAEGPNKPDHEIVMLLNFFDELRRKVPVGK